MKLTEINYFKHTLLMLAWKGEIMLQAMPAGAVLICTTTKQSSALLLSCGSHNHYQQNRIFNRRPL